MTTETCPYCGKPLEIVEKDLFGRSVFIGYKPCNCEKAQAARADEEAAYEAKKRKEALDHLYKRYKHAGIPKRYYDVTDDRSAECVEALKDGKNVYLDGHVGTMKTSLACSIAKELIDRHVPVKFATMIDVLDEIKQGFDTGYDPLPAYASVKVLILDDLGKESPKDFALERLYKLINDRYNEMLPTVVTTNYKAGELMQRLGKNGDPETAKAIISRLKEDCLTIHATGDDRRHRNG